MASAEADADMEGDVDIAPTGEAGALPAGWTVRLDQADRNVDDFQVSEMAEEVLVQTGPAGILYNEAGGVEAGDYTLSVTLTELQAPPNHREAMGVFFGGSDMEGEGQAYSYFLVRADGRYLIKRRMGDETVNITDGWIESDAVNRAVGDEDVMNAVSVGVMGEDVHFMINGEQVATLPTSELDIHGMLGLRINHNLNVRVTDFMVER